jgi:hypothetical protein
MGTWSFDMAKAPRGKFRVVASGKDGNGTRKVPELVTIIAASACGVVTLTRWLDGEKRWDMFTAEVPPIAWMPYDPARTRIVKARNGKDTPVPDLPPHPTVAEPWFTTFMREVGNAVPPAQRQGACLDWIAARSQRVAA